MGKKTVSDNLCALIPLFIPNHIFFGNMYTEFLPFSFALYKASSADFITSACDEPGAGTTLLMPILTVRTELTSENACSIEVVLSLK